MYDSSCENKDVVLSKKKNLKMCEYIFTASDPEPLMSFKFFISFASQMYQVLDYASCFSALLGMIQTNFAFLQKSKKAGSSPL